MFLWNPEIYLLGSVLELHTNEKGYAMQLNPLFKNAAIRSLAMHKSARLMVYPPGLRNFQQNTEYLDIPLQ